MALAAQSHKLEMDPWSAKQLCSLLRQRPRGWMTAVYPQGGLGEARWPRASNKISIGWGYEHGLYWDWANEASWSVPSSLFPRGEPNPQMLPLYWLGVCLQRSHNFTGELIQWFCHGKRFLPAHWREWCELSLPQAEGRDLWLIETNCSVELTKKKTFLIKSSFPILALEQPVPWIVLQILHIPVKYHLIPR